MVIRTAHVSNVSLGATEQDIREFFTFSGEMEHVEIQSVDERSQTAYVTFKDPKQAETAVLLSGSTIIDQPVTISLAADYNLPAHVAASEPIMETKSQDGNQSAAPKAEEVVTTMLAKGFILGKDALTKAKSFDERHQFTSTASARVASLDQKMGLTEKISASKTIVNDKVREMDERYQVYERTRSALSAAEQSVNNARSTLMKNQYVLSGVAWVSDAYSKVAKAADDMAEKTREKILAEEEQARKTGTNVQSSESPGSNRASDQSHELGSHQAPSQQNERGASQDSDDDQASKPATTEAVVL